MKLSLATLAALIAALTFVPSASAGSPPLHGGYSDAAKYDVIQTADDQAPPSPEPHAAPSTTPFKDDPGQSPPAAPSPAAAPAADAPAAASDDVKCGHDYNPCWCKKLDCPDCPGWLLLDPKDHCFMQCHDLSFTGWIDGGYTLNGDGKGATFNGPVIFNDRADEPMMDQLYVRMAKTVATDKCCLQWGGDVDLMYGTDSRFTKAVGLELRDNADDRWNSERFYQISMPQAYAEVAYCNWDLKIGRFYTPAGYEVATAPDNFFYSKSYMFSYSEPITQTGAMLTRKVNDQFSYLGGVYRGWDQWEDIAGEDGSGFFLGGLFQTKDGKKKFALTYLESLEANAFRADPNGAGVIATSTSYRNLFTAVYTRQVCDRLQYVIQSDYGWQDRTTENNTATGQWYGLSGYLYYQLNCCWWAGLRAEIFRDDDGTRVTQTVAGNTAVGPFPGNFTEYTLGLNYKPNAGKNLIVRPELRWDHYDQSGTGGPLPFDHGTKDDQFLAAFDMIFKY